MMMSFFAWHTYIFTHRTEEKATVPRTELPTPQRGIIYTYVCRARSVETVCHKVNTRQTNYPLTAQHGLSFVSETQANEMKDYK